MLCRLSSSLALLFTVAALSAAEPLRVFIRASQSNRGNEVHAHPRFLGEWTKLLPERGLKVDGGLELPTAEQLAKTDVLVMFAQDGGAFPKGPLRDGFEAFLKRGGGVVVLHTAAVPTKSIEDGSDYWKSVIGGSWVHGKTKWLEGKLSFYYVNRTHPISMGTANFDLDDEIYYDLDMDSRVTVLGAAYTPHMSESRRNQKNAQPGAGKITVYDIQPQMWTFENQRDGGSLIARSPACSGTSSRRSITSRIAPCCCAASRGPGTARTSMSSPRWKKSPHCVTPRAARQSRRRFRPRWRFIPSSRFRS